MRPIFKWALLILVFAIITLGGIFLLFAPEYDPKHAFATWGMLGLSALCFALGIWLGCKLDNCDMLP